MSGDVAVAQVEHWAHGLAEVGVLIGGRFVKAQVRANTMACLQGLLSGAERKNS